MTDPVGANAVTPAAPLPMGAMPSNRLCSSAEMPPVKVINVRSVCARLVGSSTATWLPATTNGAPLVLMVVPGSPANV